MSNYKKIKLVRFKDLIKPPHKLQDKEYYIQPSTTTDQPERTMRAYQNEDGQVFILGAVLPTSRSRFNIKTILKNPSKYKLIIYTINNDFIPVNQFLSNEFHNYGNAVYRIPTENLTLTTIHPSNHNTVYTVYLGKHDISLKRFRNRIYGYTGQLNAGINYHD